MRFPLQLSDNFGRLIAITPIFSSLSTSGISEDAVMQIYTYSENFQSEHCSYIGISEACLMETDTGPFIIKPAVMERLQAVFSHDRSKPIPDTDASLDSAFFILHFGSEGAFFYGGTVGFVWDRVFPDKNSVINVDYATKQISFLTTVAEPKKSIEITPGFNKTESSQKNTSSPYLKWLLLTAVVTAVIFAAIFLLVNFYAFGAITAIAGLTLGAMQITGTGLAAGLTTGLFATALATLGGGLAALLTKAILPAQAFNKSA